MAVLDPADARPNADDRSRSRRRKFFATTLAILVIAGLSLGLWQWRSVNVFGGQGNVIPWGNLEPGDTALVHAALPEPDEGTPSIITVHAVEPQIVEGTLAVEVLVCHRRPGSSGIGSVSGDQIDQYCEAYGPPEGSRLDEDDRLIYRFRSDEPGRVLIEGIRVTYSHGWHRGSQVTGPTVEVEFVADRRNTSNS